ncbi:MAG: Gldg family protein [Clostridia bacterium]|nr:Gldg family protein [Clostridia bacterium]
MNYTPNTEPKPRRRLTRRLGGAALTVGVVAALLAVNLLFSFLADRFMWQVDETVTRYVTQKGVSMYTPTEEFLDVVGDYAIPMVESVNAERAACGEESLAIKIMFCTERDRVYDNDYLRMIQYTALSLQKEFPGAVEVSYINVEQNPSAVQKYKATSSSSIYPHQIIFEFGGEFRVCSYDYFFLRSEESSTDYWAYNGEQDIASLLLAITRAASPIAAFITNHGERVEDCGTFRTLVSRAGYDVVDIDLSKDEIPADCRLLICYDPAADFLGIGNDAFTGEGESEISKLDKFLDKAYSFMLFIDKDTPRLPVLEEYMEEWGVTVARGEMADGGVGNYTIRDESQKLDKDGYIPLSDYAVAGAGASITTDMRKLPYPAKVVFPDSTAILRSESYLTTYVAADTTKGTPAFSYGGYYRNGVTRSFYDVFYAGENAIAEVNGEKYAVSTAEERFRLMTLSTESRTVQETNYLATNRPSYVAVFGSTAFASDTVLGSAAYGNADVLTSTLRAMGREVVPVDLEFKGFKVYTLDTQVYQPSASSLLGTTLFMTLLPVAACAIAGICVSVRRKYR